MSRRDIRKPETDEGGGDVEADSGEKRRTLESDVNVFGLSEDIADKLKCLDYENAFCRARGFDPLARTYFAIPASNPNQQFYYFTSLAAWLLNQCGRPFQAPGQFDDPNATVSKVLSELRALGLSLDISPAKLKQGSGDGVCVALNSLVDAAMRATRFAFKPTRFTPDSGRDEDVDEDVDEPIDEDVMGGDDHEEDEFQGFAAGTVNAQHQHQSADEEIGGVIEATVDANEWRLELERVAPQLQVASKRDTKEWRTHVELMKTNQESINSLLTTTQKQLAGVQTDISSAITNLKGRESHINMHLEHLLQSYRMAQETLSDVTAKYKKAAEYRDSLSNDFATLSDELEAVKNRLEDRGGRMTDTSPVLKLRDALKKVREEIKQMEARIGVVQHTLLHARQASLSNQTELNMGIDVY